MKLLALHIFTTAQAYQLAFLTFDFLLFYTQKKVTDVYIAT